MFDTIKGLAEGALGNAGPQDVSQAVSDHVGSMGGDELSGHLGTAAANLQQSGQSDLAQQVMSIISQAKSDPEGAKNSVVALLQSNPQILQQFAPGFAQGILAKLGV